MKNVIILGAAGRDFHNFNVYFKNNHDYKVVAFTATQIPNIDKRTYPIQLTGKHYPNGIPIYSEADLPKLIQKFNVDQCIFSYSDVSYQYVMSLASIVQAAGAGFRILGSNNTMLKSLKPVIAICGTRTGCGKSHTSRKVIDYLQHKGKNVVVIKHPMPYGNLKEQIVQRFEHIEDLDHNKCTLEEMEEYEPHINKGNIVYSGVDYRVVLREAEDDEKGCDVIVWDGGNNDMPFYNPDLLITVADPHRVNHERSYFPSEVNVRLSDVVIINKIDSVDSKNVAQLRTNIKDINPKATIIEAVSPIEVDTEELITNKRVLIIEDYSTLTLGGVSMGAGIIASQKFGATEVIDPRTYAIGKIREIYKKHPSIGSVLPALGYCNQDIKDLEASIENTPCDSVIIATSFDLTRIIKINKPTTRVHSYLQEIGRPDLNMILENFMSNNII